MQFPTNENPYTRSLSLRRQTYYPFERDEMGWQLIS